jgi:gas vesicle protein
MDREIDRQSRTLLMAEAFVLGALAGAALGLVLAPARGAGTRERLKEKARQGRDRVSRAVEEGGAILERSTTRVRQAAESTRRAVDTQVRHASRAVEEGRAAMDDIRRRGQQALANIRHEGAEAIADARTALHDIPTSRTEH